MLAEQCKKDVRVIIVDGYKGHVHGVIKSDTKIGEYYMVNLDNGRKALSLPEEMELEEEEA